MKTLKKYNEFLFESKNQKMKYFAYDWDDNILNMSTVIHMKHLVDGKWIEEDVSTSKFAKIRSLSDWKSFDGSYLEFRDFGPRGKNAFLEDSINAIKNKDFGPSWDSLLNTLSNGYIFAIITARGHESETIKNVIKYIIHNILSDDERNNMIANLISYKNLFDGFDIIKDIDSETLIDSYLDLCKFVGISSPTSEKKHNVKDGVINPEILKEKELGEFIKTINLYGKQINREVSLGFSDDDKKTIQSIKNFFNDMKGEYNLEFVVFDTSNPEIKGGIKTTIK